jgi:radical SAM protein with 4Fe4S-binding SPASM domain
MYNRINLAAHNWPYADQLLPTPSMIRQNLDSLEALSEAYGLPISVSVVLEPCVIDMSQYKHLKFVGCPLCDENSYFTIDPAGNIRICNHSPEILGNIMTDNFVDIFYKNKHVCNYRETLPKECQECIHPLKAECNGGCRAAAEQCYGTMERVDPFVTMSLGR